MLFRSQLLRLHRPEPEREQEIEARHADDAAGDHHRPEDDLLAEIELAGRWVHAFRENPAALHDPLPVIAVGEVVRDPDHQHDDHAEHERKRREVMQQLGEG